MRRFAKRILWNKANADKANALFQDLFKEEKMARFGEGVTDAQIRLARRFEAAGLTSYSQAVKAFQRRENERIEAWKKQLAEKAEK